MTSPEIVSNPFGLSVEQREEYIAFLEKKIPAALTKLRSDTMPQWGKMTAQHMVEHLQSAVMSGTIVTEKTPIAPNKMQYNSRVSLLYSPNEMPRNLQNPLFQFGLPPYSNPTIEEAKGKLLKSIDLFLRVRVQKPKGIAFSAFMGDLNFDEQLTFNYKHFKHHFTQFGLL